MRQRWKAIRSTRPETTGWPPAYLIVLPVITLMGWDAMPERSRKLVMKLTERAVATIDETDALEVFK